jgi:hypothetical protein
MSKVKPKGKSEMLKNWIKEFKAEQAARIVFFGERHLQAEILEAQIAVLKGMAENKTKKTALVVEYFAFDHQTILDNWMLGRRNIQALADTLKSATPPFEEGFDLEFYGKLFVEARELGVPLFAGFVPRSVARMAIGSTDDPNVAQKLREEIAKRYGRIRFDVEEFFFKQPGTTEHLQWFDALIRGESFREKPGHTASKEKSMSRIFPAQVIKDAALAWRSSEALKQFDQVLVCCGAGHSDYHFGAPERTRGDCFVISPRTQTELDESDPDTQDVDSGDLTFIYNHHISE